MELTANEAEALSSWRPVEKKEKRRRKRTFICGSRRVSWTLVYTIEGACNVSVQVVARLPLVYGKYSRVTDSEGQVCA